MKNIFLLPFLVFMLSCEQEGEFTKVNLNNHVSATATLLFTGNFEPTSGISVSGAVKIYFDNNQYYVTLNDFNISSGPDLKVYLSKSNTPNQFVTLGNLTSATNYTVPAGIDVADYSYVLIHCQQYNHLFATAKLIQN